MVPFAPVLDLAKSLTTSIRPAGNFTRRRNAVRSVRHPAPNSGGPAPINTPGSCPEPYVSKRTTGVCVLVPAFNEAACVADTIRSIQSQTVVPDEIIVVDDCSSDGTGDVARACGVRVIRTPSNTGSKATALNHALQFVNAEFTLAIDADTTLAADAVEVLMKAMDDPKVAAACGMVLPRHVNTIWERGRYIEYLFAFSLYKPIQDYYERPLLASGCFSVYRTSILKAKGGWPTRTVAEDMDLTWVVYMDGWKVRFVPEAMCYPIEPNSFKFLSRQLRRWSCGFVQTVMVHWKEILHVPFLRMMVAIGLWDATLASLAFLLVLPILSIAVSPLFLLGYFIDLPAVLVPVMAQAWKRGEVLKALASLPGFFVMRFVNAYYTLNAVWRELIIKKRVHVFEKGH